MSLATKKLSRLLRTHEQTLLDLNDMLRRATGKDDQLSALAEAHDMRLDEALRTLTCPLEASAEEVYGSLMKKIEENDTAVSAHLGGPDILSEKGCIGVVALALEIAGLPRGYFLKKDVAERLFRQNPPQNLMRELNMHSVEELLRQFSLEELFPAIRFSEDNSWLMDIFFHPYTMLTPDDFEERPVRIIVLPERFREVAARFAGKKLHHISHLKELGVIFVMPMIGEDHEAPPSATLEVLTLVLHYLHEVPFYSRIFRRFAKDRHSFAENLTSALRGDVLPQPPAGERGKERFLIVQRYLAKDDATDPRLFLPHLNPEAVHWRLVEDKLDEFAKKNPKLGLGFWRGLGAVGEYFPLGSGHEQYMRRGVSESVAISFDLIDNLISHNRRSPVLAKYLYHQQEALWNEIFYAYLGQEHVETMMEENLEKGYIEIS